MHLLHIEDSIGDITLVQEAIRTVTLDLQLTTIRDGEQALAFLRRQEPYANAVPPDLVLLDLNLPRVSGYEVLAELQHMPALQSIPTVVLSSSEEPQDICQCC